MLVFTLAQPTVPVEGGGLFPVRRIYCIGRNYADHAREMGGDPQRDPPFFFQKPSDAVQPVAAGETGHNTYPPLTDDYHSELELVVLLGSGGRDIARADALNHVFGYAVGFDMTRRDAQQRMKDTRRPWEVSKAFDASAPIGLVRRAENAGHLDRGEIKLTVNGATRQRANLVDMIWSVAEQISEVSRWSALAAGDIIFSGTPAGVGAVKRGDTLLGHIDGLPDLALQIV